MARQQAIFPQINFINGLITETTALTFPENACIETWNCVFDHTGLVARRGGLDVETGHSMLTLPQATVATDVYAEYLWETVGSQDSQPFLVLQRGALLYFFKVKDTLIFSDTSYHQVVDLTSYVPSGSTKDPSLNKCSFAEGRGHLLVTNNACDPLYVEYDSSSELLIVNQISIKYRDFKGLDDSLTLTERVTETETGLKATNPNHYYNLINQGWHLGDALTQWDSARTDMPSNADNPQYYRASETDVFDNARVDKAFSGLANTPAPKGHFILDAGSPSRNQALIDDGYTGVVIAESTLTSIPLVALTTVSGGTLTRPSNMFDGDNNQSSSNSTVIGSGAYIGKTLNTTTSIQYVALFASTSGVGNTGTLTIYGKVGSAPASGTDGTVIGTATFTSTSAANRIIVAAITDATAYDHIWIRNSSGASKIISEMNILVSTPEYNRPSLVAFYAGRAVYAGLSNEGSMNNIYFSQIVERNEQYGQCYQKNDPTDENFFDLLPDDGGVVTIPEIGIIRAMVSYQSSLIVIASNGVWTLSGSSRGPFKADDYEVRKISDISTLSSTSVMTRRGIPIWWAEDGIYTVQYDANYDSFTVASITEQRIATFIKQVPLENRQYVKGVYDYNDDVLYWMYREEPITTESERHTYNRVLAMNGITGAFYPWSFSEDGILRIKGFCFVRTPTGLSNPIVKYIIDNPVDNTLTFAEINDYTNWIDWSVEGSELDYSSYFITGYKIRGEGMKHSDITYFMPFMNEHENSSLFVQSIWSFTTSPSTGKWSTRQQCYRDGPFNEAVRWRRLRLRGSGKSVQFKFQSETGKPFYIIGWSTLESVQADV